MAQRLDYSDGYYYGEVEGGEENGFGIFYWNSGNRYEGDWLNGQMHGFGTMYYANGDKYEGYWKEHAKQPGSARLRRRMRRRCAQARLRAAHGAAF